MEAAASQAQLVRRQAQSRTHFEDGQSELANGASGKLPIDFDVMLTRSEGLIGVRNEARVIRESPPHPFRQTGFKVHPLSRSRS